MYALAQVIGGLGMFLLGLTILVDGLKGVSGRSLREALSRFTRSPATGALSGAIATALVQSSTAVTVTAVGFVSAGLLTFPQALGIIFGANVGTTATGWIVSLVGFKLELAAGLAPLIAVGIALYLFGRGRMRFAGWALAGFGLMFTGLAMTQAGVPQFRDLVSFERFPGDTVVGRIELVAIGIVVTVITRSSSAGVAMALIAMSSGIISFAQAGALVIGMDIGTTATALVATIGGSSASRRTAYGHVVFNLFTGAAAFIYLPVYVYLVGYYVDLAQAEDAQFALVAFHSSFNVIGTIAGVALAEPFSRLLEWLVPERAQPLLRRLDRKLLAEPEIAIEPLAATACDIGAEALALLDQNLNSKPEEQSDEERATSISEARRTLQDYMGELQFDEGERTLRERHVTIMHILDHIERLLHRLVQRRQIATLQVDDALQELAEPLRQVVARAIGRAPQTSPPENAEPEAEQAYRRLADRHQAWRAEALEQAAAGDVDVDRALRRLDTVRWLERTAYHVWRIVHYTAMVQGKAATNSRA